MPTGVYKRDYNKIYTLERNKKISKSRIGMKFSEEHRKNLSKSHIGKAGFWRGKKRSPEDIEKFRKSHLGKKKSEVTKKKMSEVHKGKKYSLGYKQTEEHKRKISESHRGERSHFWKGGISFEPYSTDWTETLKRAIRERDNYICQLCGKTQIEELERIEQKLTIHHKDYCKKNCAPDNLITLCKSCNSKVNFNRNYWIEFFKTKESI